MLADYSVGIYCLYSLSSQSLCIANNNSVAIICAPIKIAPKIMRTSPLLPAIPTVSQREGDRTIWLMVLTKTVTIPKVSPDPTANRALSRVKPRPTPGKNMATFANKLSVIPVVFFILEKSVKCEKDVQHIDMLEQAGQFAVFTMGGR